MTALVLASLGFFLITLDVSIVNLALPSIREDLGGDISMQQWVLDGYTLFFAALLLCFGNLSDRIGAKRAFTIGIAAFGLSSLLCAVAPSTYLLIGARCLQGVTAALMLPASMTLISEGYPDSRLRSKALGFWAAGGAVASAAGPMLGGWLSTWDWRLIFAVNIPFCLVMIIAAKGLEKSPRTQSHFDWVGQFLALVGLVAVIFALIEGAILGYGDLRIITLAIIGIASLGLFVYVQSRVKSPMMPLSLFEAAPMRIALFGGFTFIFSWFGSVFLASLYLQQSIGLSAATAGLIFVPSAILSFFGNIVSGPLSNRFGPRFPVMLGMASLVVGLSIFALSANLESALFVCISLILIGAGGSVAMPPVANVVLGNAPAGQSGVASAVSNTFRQLGGALAIALFGVLLSRNGDFTMGMQLSLGIAGCLALACLCLSYRLPGRSGRLVD
ncbi:MFS transporter [Corynebacterium sp. AOP40-9SA-29]|uniref:MFS transporter n=1 Tax=Corynebacterium sp. AOP40-9SA-29 TaxID=3457677 RepID=UPI004033B30B